MTIEIDGKEVVLSTKLRSAYYMQSLFNHKPYMDIFKDVGTMSIQEQIKVLYAAYHCGGEDQKLTAKEFEDKLLDTFELSDLLSALSTFAEAMMGNRDTDPNVLTE